MITPTLLKTPRSMPTLKYPCGEHLAVGEEQKGQFVRRMGPPEFSNHTFAYMHKCNVLCERPKYKIGGFPPGVGCKVLGNMVSYTLNPSMKADTPGGKVANAGILGLRGFIGIMENTMRTTIVYIR